MTVTNQNHHIVVVGAGIVGSAIAFQLAQRGAAVTIIDAHRPGLGASGVSFAWINAREKNPRHYHELNRRSLDMWERFARQLGGQVGLTWGGELRWAATPEGASALAGRVKTLQSWGYPIWMLNKDQMQQIEPQLVAGTVSAASYTAIDGHVDTAKVIQACLHRATERGARLLTETQVTGLELFPTGAGRRRRVKAIRAKGQEITADTVVLAGGPDMPALAALAEINLPLYHTFGATILTEPTAPILRQTAVVHTQPDVAPQIALRQLPDGTVMIHGGEGGTSSRSLGETDEEVELVMNAARKLIPTLDGVEIGEIRRGRRPIPQDGHPVIGFTQAVPNLYLATMHSGVTLAALVGELAAIEIMDGVQIELLQPYRLERF